MNAVVMAICGVCIGIWAMAIFILYKLSEIASTLERIYWKMNMWEDYRK